MARFGFCGPTYSSQSIIADCQRCMNLYPETIESQIGQGAVALYCTPGLSEFAALPASPVRGEITINGRFFAVGGQYFCEVTSAGAVTNLGNIGNDLQPVSMVTNGTAGNQVLICSAGGLYVFNLSTNTFTIIGSLQGIPSMVEFCDGYGIALLANSNKFQVSNLEDFTTWNPLSIQQVSVFPENVGAIKQAFRQLFVLGLDGHAQVYYNSGASLYTPFDVISGAYMELGVDAPQSVTMLDNSVFWIGGNQNGNGIAWRANGYTPLRVSNHAVETAWAAYPSKGNDAVAYAYVDQGHTFWVVRFPSANNGFGATWVYDAATQMWHERGYWSQQPPTGYSAHLSTCHAFAFGRHLVGDWNSANIYAMAIGTYADNGKPIRRFRRAPHVSNEHEWLFIKEVELLMEVGLGPDPPLLDGAGNPRGPQVMFQWSRDGGQTWGIEYWVDAGQAGNFLTRVRKTRMGRARDFVFQAAVTDPIPWRFIDASIDAGPDYQKPTQRLNKKLATMA